jgi:NAD(P)-dependent dehydrogenase (short-subunit alcohol dehydrogenase family)
VVITGASSGIGLAAAQSFARAGDEVVLLGRDQARLTRAVDLVREAGGTTPASYRANFAVLDEVRTVGAAIAGAYGRIDVFANNAGNLVPARRLTVDGLDLSLQTNHLGGFLLAHLLLDRLQAAAPARVISTSSAAEAWGTLEVTHPGRRQLVSWLGYGAGKQANILFTLEAARRWGPLGVSATCYFPGLIRSGFGWRSPLFTLGKLIPGLFRTPEQGADTMLWLANDPAGLVPGGYYAWRRLFPATPRSTNPQRARQLWDASLDAVGLPR